MLPALHTCLHMIFSLFLFKHSHFVPITSDLLVISELMHVFRLSLRSHASASALSINSRYHNKPFLSFTLFITPRRPGLVFGSRINSLCPHAIPCYDSRSTLLSFGVEAKCCAITRQQACMFASFESFLFIISFADAFTTPGVQVINYPT